MILSYREAVEKCGSEYKLSQAVLTGCIFKEDSGIYATERYAPELGVIMKKYPKAVLTGEYAFFVHGLTDVIPDRYDLATPSKAARLTDARVRQIYVRDEVFPLGIEEKVVDGVPVRIYARERMLIELLRNKNSMPYDLHKEIIMNYREIIGSLDIPRIQEYASIFPKSKMITKALGEEVM